MTPLRADALRGGAPGELEIRTDPRTSMAGSASQCRIDRLNRIDDIVTFDSSNPRFALCRNPRLTSVRSV